MEIFAACPFAVSTLAWEPASGRRSLSVTIKATFTLVPGAVATIAPHQEAAAAAEPDLGSGTSLGDLTPFKPKAEVLLVGHAHAPRGAPVDALLARARVGPFRKALSITGDRTWVPSFDGLRPSVAVPFRRMPIRYERAVRAGENLGGIDIIAQGAELGRPLPNIAAITDQGGETPGFGPLPLGWRARRHGQSDAAVLWASRIAVASGPPPPGFDFRVLNAAPPEQQMEEIPPGVEIQLENLHPDHPRLETRLPALRVKLFRLAPRADRAAEMPVRCDTLTIDTDRGLAFVIWRGAVLLDGGDEASAGRLLVAAEGEGERLGPEHADRFFAQIGPHVTYVDAGPVGWAINADARRGSYPPVPRPLSPPTPRPATVADELRQASLGAPGSAFRPQPTGFEAAPLPSLARDSYPPPPPPPGQHVTPRPPANRGTLPPARPPSRPPADDDDDGEVTPPRGYPGVPDRTATGTIRPSPSAPPLGSPAAPDRTATGTIRPPASTPQPLPPPVPPPRPVPPPPPSIPLPDEPTPAIPLERTMTGTIRPPGAVLPFVRPTAPDAPPDSADALSTLSPPPPSVRAAGEAIDTAAYCAIKVEAWRTEDPLDEVIARLGLTPAAFAARERAEAEAMAREAAEGRGDRAVALLESLWAARDA